MMALFKCAVTNEFNTYAHKSTRLRSLPVEAVEPPPVYNEGALLVAIQSGSAELRAIMTALASSSAEMLALLFKDDDLKRINNRMRMVFGYSKSRHDVVTELQTLLTN